ncbi:MAG: carbohydrate binding family 9 domain-containing protein [Gemmatimonadetes bacterium]|nr:carbohydrate binding family 9 domain-containing protein [Gemmatimonadota bacterium]
MERNRLPVEWLGVAFGAAIVVLFAPAWAFAQQAPAVDTPSVTAAPRLLATRANGPVTLDGVLDEPAWALAPVASGFVQNEPAEGRPASLDTEVRVLYDDRAVYFGVFAHDDEPGSLVVSDLRKDFNAAAGDAVLIVIDTFLDRRNGFEFATNPAGAKWDAQMSNEGRESNANWDGIWDVRTRVASDGWYAEIRIPLLTLRFTRADPQTWGINFQRRLRRRNEESFWAPLPRIYDIHRVSMAGSMDDLRQIRPGRNLRVKPYAAGTSSSGARPTKRELDGGLDVKYGLTAGLTLDVTVNTDFSQVEADEQQVNLTRFSLLFPEKREFFLENSGIFQFGLPSTGQTAVGSARPAASGRQNSPPDMRLFFSRQIGLSSAGSAIPIQVGSRVSGRVGAYSIGALNIQQAEQGTVPSTNFTAVRASRAVLANSDFGFMLLNKEESGAGYNRVGGVDANFRFGELSLGGYAVKTDAPQSVVPGSGEDFTARANFTYTSRTWLARGLYEVVGQRFRNEMGFVPRTGVDHVASYGRMNLRPAWASERFSIREIGPHFHFDQFDRRDGTGTESRYLDWHIVLTMNDSGFFEAGVNGNRENNVRPFTLNAARGVIVAPGEYDFDEYFALYRSNNAARFSFETRFSSGDLYDGHRNGYAFAPTIRMNEHLNASFSVQVNDIDLPSTSYVSTLMAARLDYSVNTRVFFNALVQYNTDTEEWSSNVRLNVIHRPLSDFFLVYNERRSGSTGDLVDRSIVAKLTYLFAF